jgi:hypothetical protein
MAPTTTITTALPDNVSASELVKFLHDHDTYIKITCPQLISYELESGVPSTSEPVIYRVTDKKPFGQTTFSLTLTNTSDGINTLVNAKAPLGSVVIKGQWQVTEGSLIENVDIDANMVMKKMVKGNVEKHHAEHHVQLMNLAQVV